MTARSQLSELRRELLEELKDEAKKHIGPIPPSLNRYYQDYKREFVRYRRSSSKDELVGRVKRARLVFVGDYHTLVQAQKTNLKILREVVTERREIILGLEMVHSRDQRYLDGYMAGEMDEGAFLTAIRYVDTWGFRWESYRSLLEFARQWKIPVHGLNVKGGGGGPGLRKRDRHAARLVADLLESNPGHLVYVVFGDLHLASGHLPLETKQELRSRGITGVDPLVIYQNSETIYWKLHRRGLHRKVDVVQIRKNAFCIINTTPWVKLQSYIFWERNRKDLMCSLYNFCAYGLDPADAGVEFSDQVLTLIETVNEFFHVRARNLDHFTVLTLEDLNPFLKSLSRLKRYRLLRRQLLQEESLFIPEKRVIFLRFPEVNHAAEQGAVYLNWVKTRYEPLVNGGQDEFYRRVIRRALGFLGSLLINPKRKHWHEEDFRRFLAENRRRRRMPVIERRRLEAGRWVLRHLERERARPTSRGRDSRRPPVIVRAIHRHDERCLYQVSAGLGQMLGATLYNGMLRGDITRDEVGALFGKRLAREKEAPALYVELRKRLAGAALRTVSKSDRF